MCMIYLHFTFYAELQWFVIIITHHELGLNGPLSASSNSLFP
jgi:hypothetical protein